MKTIKLEVGLAFQDCDEGSRQRDPVGMCLNLDAPTSAIRKQKIGIKFMGTSLTLWK